MTDRYLKVLLTVYSLMGFLVGLFVGKVVL